MNIRRRRISAVISAMVIPVAISACGVPATFIAGRPGTGFSAGYVNGIVRASWPENASASIAAVKVVVRLQSAPDLEGQPGKWTTQNVVEYHEILDGYRVNAVCVPGLWWRIQYRATSWSNDSQDTKATTGALSGPARLITRCP